MGNSDSRTASTKNLPISAQLSDPKIRQVLGKLISYFSTKIYELAAQKDRLVETILLSSQNIYLESWIS